MGRRCARKIAPARHSPRPRRKCGAATTARHHRAPDVKEDESRAGSGRWVDAREPDAWHPVPWRLRQPVPGGAASRRSDGAQAHRDIEGKARRGASEKLNAEARHRVHQGEDVHGRRGFKNRYTPATCRGDHGLKHRLFVSHVGPDGGTRMNLTHVTIVVKDQKAALEFYTRTMGFEKRADYQNPGQPRWLTVAPKGQAIEMVLWQAGEGSDPNLPPVTRSRASARVGCWRSMTAARPLPI